jgi:hypothetical protein
MASEVVVKLHGYDDNPTYDDILYRVSRLAGKWRVTKDDAVAEEYRTLLKAVLLMGWRGSLMPEEELPDRLMPEAYFAQFDDKT